MSSKGHYCSRSDENWFDRSICPEPCGVMHTRCDEHGAALGYCPHEDDDQADPVNHPDHYRWLPVEAIEITELFGFRLGNTLKYILRADHKGQPLQDLKKALWYLEREISAREKSM